MIRFTNTPSLHNEHTNVQPRILALAVLLLSISPGMADEDHSIRRGPRILKGSETNVGRLIPDIAMSDVTGRTVSLRPGSESRLLVVCLTGTGCPLAKRFTPTLAHLEQSYHPQGVDFVFINPNKSESVERVRAAIATHRLQGSYVRDTEREFVGRLAAHTTTEVFVIDTAGTLRYRGAVDDQYGIGYALPEPRVRYLADALDALLENQRPPVEATWAPGCELRLSSPVDTVKPVTYHNRISRILQNNCVSCHHDDGAAPFSLKSADAVHDYAGMIADVVRRGTMPPWFAAPQEAASDTLMWANDCSLSASDKADLLAWLGSDRPLGEPGDAPLSMEHPTEWTIGEPDIILQFPEPVAVAATGQMPYQNIAVRTNFEGGKWVKAVEIHPGAPEVVHHVLVFVGGENVDLENTAGFLAAYVPGNRHQINPAGFAKWLPPGAELHFQMHYTPNGTATTDQTRLGLIFANEPPEYAVLGHGIANDKIEIPPGVDNHPEHAVAQFPDDVRLISFYPHMHVRGKSFRYELVHDDGRRETLLDVPHYDFNWQLEYRPVEPILVPKGTKIAVTGCFDNSDGNPANPDPSKTVTWGPQTDDEMLLGHVDYYIPAKALSKVRVDSSGSRGE